jgi:hypothetical protein
MESPALFITSYQLRSLEKLRNRDFRYNYRACVTFNHKLVIGMDDKLN